MGIFVVRNIVVALMALFLSAAAHSQNYPTKPIRLIMPYSPGAGGDFVVRPLVEKLGPVLGQPVLVEYKPGAVTVIGTELLAKSAPDGYTIGFVTDSHSLNPIFRKNLPYDSLNDFAPITQLVDVPLMLVTHLSVPAKKVAELVAYARANPGKLSYASLGYGGPHYIFMEWFKLLTGTDLFHVPYPGSAPAVTAVLGGQVQLMFLGGSTALTHAKTGRLTIIATATAKRLAAAPEIPTIAESGYSEFAFSVWYGLLAPGKTPPEIVARLNHEIVRILRSDDIQARYTTQGLVPAPSTPEEFGAKLRRDAEHYAKIVKATGARGE